MSEINYEDLELRALAHMAYQCGPRMKSVSVDPDAVRELSRRQTAYHFPVTRSGVLTSEPAQPWDPAPPLRMGPQRCLSSRETIERLAMGIPGLLPAEPYQAERTLKRATMHWRDIFEQDRERTSRTLSRNLEHEARLTGRHVWLGGDYIDDGNMLRGVPPEAAAEQWRRVREALADIEREGGAVAYLNPAYPPHSRDSGPRG